MVSIVVISIHDMIDRMDLDCLAQIGAPPEEKSTSEQSTFTQIFKLRSLHLLALFIFVYVGVEVRLTLILDYNYAEMIR